MIKRTTIQIVAGVVLTVFAAGIILTGGRLEAGWLRFYSVAVLVAMGLFACWEHFAWRWALVQKYRGGPRDLRGTWKGRIRSFWQNPETGVCPPEKDVYLVIRQTATSCSVVLLTDESRSASRFAMIEEDTAGATLLYIYVNRPDLHVEHRSRMHHGTTSLDITGRPPTRLRGRYWTDRDSRGELDFVERNPSASEDFDEAQRLFSALPAVPS